MYGCGRCGHGGMVRRCLDASIAGDFIMSKEIDAATVRHIGKLGRIELSDKQVELFGHQLSSILGYFDKMAELDTANVEPMVHAIELRNALADDTPRPSLTADEALANAPARDGDYFKVPKVIGDSQ